MEKGDASGGGDQFVQYLQPFRPELDVQGGGAGEVAARPAETCDQSDLHRVGRHCKDDRDGRGGGLGGERRRDIGAADDVDLAADEVGRQDRQPVVLAAGPAIFDCDVATLDEACFAQALQERA